MAKLIPLKPQDLVVALKLVSLEGQRATIASLADQLSMSASEVHASLRRGQQARLLRREEDGGIRALGSSLMEFVLYGARYAFPGVLEGVTSGVPTAYAAKPLSEHMIQSAELLPVWPHAKGKVRGVSLAPLYPTAPDAALKDQSLYELLALVDAMRIGSSRERELAMRLLEERLV
jgi:hypothetical protein